MAGSQDQTQIVGLQQFAAGWSVDKKFAAKGQFYYSQHLNFRTNPGSLTVEPAPSAAAASGTVTGLVLDMDQIPNGDRYAVDDGGEVYKIAASNGAWSTVGSLSETGGAGLIYRADYDHIYITGQDKLGRIKYVSNAGGTFQADFFDSGKSADSEAYKTGGANTYTLPGSISESATATRTFVSDIEPLIKIGVKVVSAGTGDVTLTLHDDANNVLATKTIAHASLTTGINYFTFSSPITLLVKPNGLTYHFHLTVSTGTTTVQTTTSSSLADCDLEIWANALVTPHNKLHPMTNFLQYTLIGNGRYVAAYEPLQDSPDTSDFLRHRLTLPAGFEVCSFAQNSLYSIIGAEKRSTSGDFQEGALFFWDGISTTYNDWFSVPEGSPEALFSEKNITSYFAGGSLYQMAKATYPTKIRNMRNTDSTYSNVADTTHVYPHTMTVRRGMLLMAYPSQTTNQSLEHAVYSMGTVAREFPVSFGQSYTMSHGDVLNNGGNNLRIGMIKNFGDTLYMSWRNDYKTPAYGVDVIDNTSAPYGTFKLESLYFDAQLPIKYKRAVKIICTYDALPAGVTISLKYKIDGAADWTFPAMTSTSTYAVAEIDQNFIGIEFGFDGTCSGTTPSIQSIYLLFDPLSQEREVG